MDFEAYCSRLATLSEYYNFSLDQIRKEKHKYRKIHKVIQDKKWDFLKEEAEVVNKVDRLHVISQIFSQISKLYKLDSDIESSDYKIDRSTKEYIKSIYNGQFNGNILVVGRTGCGKTTFLEKLVINKFFGEIVKTEWISGIETDSVREAEIQSCFDNETSVHVATEKDELDSLIDTFKLRGDDKIDNVNIENPFGEKKKMDRLYCSR